MEDQKIFGGLDVIDTIHGEMKALADKYNLKLWFGMNSKFPVMEFMFDNSEKDVIIEINVREQMGNDIRTYINRDVADYIVDIFKLNGGNEVTAE